MYDIFDVIDSLKDLRKISGRKLADMAGMKPTTLASMMSRRPASIPVGYLKAIASALDVKWNEILNVPESAYQGKADDEKIPTALSERDYKEVMHRFFNFEFEPPSVHVRYALERERELYEEQVAKVEANHEKYKNAILHMLGTLNSNGLRNVMQHILELNVDPEFSSENNKEDTE